MNSVEEVCSHMHGVKATTRNPRRANALTQARARRGYFSHETKMNDRKIEEALRLFKSTEPVPAISEYQREQRALHENRERLKG
jgi:hypothetical protein